MEFHENRSQKPFRQSPFWLMLILPYRLWKAWRARVQTRKILSRMSDETLNDIGLTRHDIDRW
ncbi:DUF1127 domain-containing protein [Samsonia erythrinae]|uniref:Uncharacterized protein YjiS (DUF1127 family) n=1 Tax=Samsonia erythrinae TaxID=160434 RepID=A0A4R3VEN2_9GAMM|nr:DUF1127 domain-containing protein [Samsonia erythrinae]TCV02182.1 uncharacterized protein YjiS (DUF1127 family) [Samsonia erythrinae]